MGTGASDWEQHSQPEVEDLIAPDSRLLIVGINPGRWSAATGLHFAHPGNRFWPAIRRAGIIDREIPRGVPLSDEDRAALLASGLAITNLVARPTTSAAELGADELRAGAERLRRMLTHWRPQVIAIAGITAYRTAFSNRTARPGRQAALLEGIEVWVVPNPSGLNAHETIESLAAAYREPARRAGLAVCDAGDTAR